MLIAVLAAAFGECMTLRRTIGRLMGAARSARGESGPPNRRTSTMRLRGIEAFVDARHAGGRQDRLGFKTDHSLARPCTLGEPHALQLLQTANGETARLWIVDARIVEPQVDEAESSAAIRIVAPRRVQRCFDLPRESGADFMLGLGGRALPICAG